MKHVHICLVSRQTVPNVLPLLHEKPEQVVLLKTAQMEAEAVALAAFASSRGIKVDVREIEAFDFTAVLRLCDELLKDYTAYRITLNLTGGTKIQALAVYQKFYFDGDHVRIIYLDTGNNRLLTLNDPMVEEDYSKNLLKVKDYLACYQKSFVSGCSGQPPAGIFSRKEATFKLAKLLIESPPLLKKLNGIVAEHRNNPKKHPYLNIDFQYLPEGGKELCELLLTHGIATKGLNGSVNINGAENLAYANGHWLEEFVFLKIEGMKLCDADIRMNVDIVWKSTSDNRTEYETKNELDVVFTRSNILHTISCKTSALDQYGEKASIKGKEALYELDVLGEKVGGLFGRTMLVSAHQLSDTSRRRARNMGIAVVDGRDVLNLPAKILKIW